MYKQLLHVFKNIRFFSDDHRVPVKLKIKKKKLLPIDSPDSTSGITPAEMNHALSNVRKKSVLFKCKSRYWLLIQSKRVSIYRRVCGRNKRLPSCEKRVGGQGEGPTRRLVFSLWLATTIDGSYSKRIVYRFYYFLFIVRLLLLL